MWWLRVAVFLQLGADLVRVGVGEFVEDLQGVLPGVAGGLRVAGGVISVAKVGESAGFAITVAEILKQAEGALIAGDGLGMVAEVVWIGW